MKGNKLVHVGSTNQNGANSDCIHTTLYVGQLPCKERVDKSTADKALDMY